MSEPTADRDELPDDGEDLGSLSVEDDPDGTVDPADLAGSADSADKSDAEQDLQPTHSEGDLED